MRSRVSVERISQVVIAGLIVASAIAQFVLMQRATNGDFLNSYPLISPDGFDWIYEGAYLRYALTEGIDSLPILFVLRHPMFVLISVLDSFASHRGIVFAASLSVAFAFSQIYLVLILRIASINWNIVLWAILVFTLSPISYFRSWILPDPLAIGFLLGSTFHLLRYWQSTKRTDFLLAAIMTLLGGWTQTYAVIPFFVGSMLIIMASPVVGRKMWWDAVVVLATLVTFLVGLLGWYRLIPHEFAPNPFRFLAINANMFAFYVHTWLFYFTPVLVVACYFIYYVPARSLVVRIEHRILLTVSATFAGLLLFYQWPEARFASYYFGFVVAIAAIMLSHESVCGRTQDIARYATGGLSLAILLVTSFVAVPENYWNPIPATIHVEPTKSWAWQLATMQPQDRFNLALNCHRVDEYCAAVPDLPPIDLYRDRLARDYRSLRLMKGQN